MERATEILIFDKEGKILWQGEVEHPTLGLQVGEIFWFGTPDKRTWTTITSIVYGIDVEKKRNVVEMVVELSSAKSTKISEPKVELKPKVKIVELGVHKIDENNALSLDNSNIILTIGGISNPSIGGASEPSVKKMTLQLFSKDGPKAVYLDNGKVGSSFKIKDTERVIIVVLTHVRYRDVTVRIIEHKKEG